MLLPVTLFNMLNTAIAEPTTEVGVYGMWQTFVFNGDSWRQQQRIHLRTSIEWESVEAYIDFMDARIWGSEINYKTNKDTLANLYQGYVRFPVLNIGGVNHTIQVGRQEFILNDQRHFGPGFWALGGRSFDAAVLKGTWDTGYWRAAVMQLTNGTTFLSGDPNCTEDCSITTDGNLMYIVHGENKWDNLSIKPYFIHQRSNPEVDIYRRIYSPGVLLTGKSNALFYKVEGTYQFGQESDVESHLAWMGVGELGYQKDRFKLSAYGEINSGDGDSSDDVNNDFEGFIGRYHGLRGWSDQVGATNLRDYSLKVQLPLQDKLIAKIEGHQFQMDQPTGNLYTSNGAVAGTASPDNTERNLGKELDLLVVHKPFDGITMKWGHSIYLPEGPKQDVIGSEPVHFSYLWMTVQQ